MTVKEAAEVLEVTASLVYRLCGAGLIAHNRIGLGRGAIRISKADLDAYVASRRVEAKSSSAQSNDAEDDRLDPLLGVPDCFGPGGDFDVTKPIRHRKRRQAPPG